MVTAEAAAAVTVERLGYSNYIRWYTDLVALAVEHGERRVRKASLDWLRELKVGSLGDHERGGPLVLFVTDGEDAVGVTVSTFDTLGPNFTVVHTDHRRKGVGSMLVRAKLTPQMHYTTLVALDNVPSLRLMFSVGLVADGLVDNGSGKQVLRFRK
jgi:GNAT superfamily N-acetyltransferase